MAPRATSGDTVSPAHLELLSMNPLAANRTAARPRQPPPGAAKHCSFVEDLNWPALMPPPDRKPARPTEVWVPGPNGHWEGVTPTLQ
jgi:hypothetical protein